MPVSTILVNTKALSLWSDTEAMLEVINSIQYQKRYFLIIGNKKASTTSRIEESTCVLHSATNAFAFITLPMASLGLNSRPQICSKENIIDGVADISYWTVACYIIQVVQIMGWIYVYLSRWSIKENNMDG